MAVCVLLLAAGCNDFLERQSQNEIIPVTTEHYKELLQGEGYFQKVLRNYRFVAYMSDDVEWFDARINGTLPPGSGSLSDDGIDEYGDSYTWQREVENDDFTDRGYLYFYSQVLIANICLDAVDDTDGTQAEKEILRGQAAFTRAFAYFILANTYGPAYNTASPADLCIPINRAVAPTPDPIARATMREVWDELIVHDIGTALDNLRGKNINNLYEIKYSSALVLAMRIALYMERWDDAIAYGEEFLALDRYPLQDISMQTRATAIAGGEGDVTVVNFMNRNNSELTWVFGEADAGSVGSNTFASVLYPTNNAAAFFRASETNESGIEGVLNTFDFQRIDMNTVSGDRRRCYWFIEKVFAAGSLWVARPFADRVLKFDHNDGLAGQFALRTGEVYITLAEAYARSGNPDNGRAVQLLNDLRVKRIAPYTSLSTSDFPQGGKTLVQFILEERRRELCFEEMHRWWDLRRTGQPRIVHRLRNVYYVLDENDPAYVVNFPELERSYNGPFLVPNYRPERGQQNNPF